MGGSRGREKEVKRQSQGEKTGGKKIRAVRLKEGKIMELRRKNAIKREGERVKGSGREKRKAVGQEVGKKNMDGGRKVEEWEKEKAEGMGASRTLEGGAGSGKKEEGSQKKGRKENKVGRK